MPKCQACHADLDQATLVDSKCPVCGKDFSRPEPRPEDTDAERVDADTIQTIELPEEGVDPDSEPKEADPHQTHAPTNKPGTVALSNEATIEFDSEEFSSDVFQTGQEDLGKTNAGAADSAEHLVTAQWQTNVEQAEGDPNFTIRQSGTIGGSVTGTSSLVVKSRQFTSKSDAPAPAVTPSEAPDYELLDVIGEGGMGVVYSAKQASIARTVAIKMLKQKDAANDGQREKFISEAVVTGELDHPNIVPIYDLGANDAGALFYSMKRVKGTPWNDVIGEKSLDENLGILMRVADAVSFAHANGVVHRDLKPENVMLGDYGEVLVMDWGLARISSDFPNADSVSQSDVMGGTPAYMAPEMATGPVEKVTTASDIYLLGAMLFEVITGKPPHSGKTVMACLFAAAKNKIIETKHTGELIDIAYRAMESEPAERYRIVHEFQQAIRDYQSHSESIVLTESAEKNLAAAESAGDYELFSRALYGLEEALSLWGDNHRAEKLLSQTRVAYAEGALAKHDYDLGISLLDAGDALHADTLAKLERGRLERQQRQRRVALLRRMVAGLVLAIVGVVTVAYFAVSQQRDEAVAQRDRAQKAEKEALSQRDRAQKAETDALEQRDRAVEAEGVAQANYEAAEKARADEERQRKIAVEAKDAEEYSAYVARIGLAKARLEENSFDRAAALLQECPPRLRNWEWGRLWRLCNLADRTWELGGPVESVAVSPDGTLHLTGDWSGKATLWDAATGEERLAVEHGRYVHAVAFDASGNRFATGSSDHTVRVYDTASGGVLQTLAGHDDAVLTVRFSPDGRELLTGGYDNTARRWDIESGEEIQTLRGHSWWVWAAGYATDGEQIVTAGQDGKAIVWTRDTGSGSFNKQTEFTSHEGPVYAAEFSPDGARVATGGYDGRVLTWDPAEVRPIDVAARLDDQPDPPTRYREAARHDGPVRSVDFSADGARLASGGQDNVLRVVTLDGGPTQSLRGHASHVLSCAFSPDGQSLLSGGRDEQARLWRPTAYAEQVRLLAASGAGRPDAVLGVSVSANGARIATAGRDRTASLWDASSGRLLQRFTEGHDYLASTAQFFAWGTRLATGAGDGTVRVWDVATGTQVTALEGTGRTSALAVAEAGDLVVTGDAESSAVVWDATTGERLAVLAGHEAAVTCAAFGPDGGMLATADDRGKARLWRRDAEGGWREAAVLNGHSRTITAAAFSPDGARLYTASGDNTCGQWDTTTGEEIRGLVLKHPDWVTDLSLSGDGRLLLTSCDDGALRVWSTADARLEAELRPDNAEAVFTSVELSADGSRVLAASAADGTVREWVRAESGGYQAAEGGPAVIVLGEGGGLLWAARYAPGGGVLTIGGNDARLWDPATGEVVRRFSPHGAVASVDLSLDGTRLVTGSWDRSAKVWDLETGKALARLDGVHRGFVNSVRYSPDGARVLTASNDGTARFWDPATGKTVGEPLTGHASRVRQAVFSPDGERVLTSSSDKTARVWDAATGKELQRLVGHDWAVLCGAFSPAGGHYATGGEDNLAILWSKSGEPLFRLSGHTGSVTSVAFSRNGSRLVTGSEDGTARVWDTASGEEVLALAGHTDSVTAVAFSPDGLRVVTTSRDGSTLVWPAAEWAP